MIDSSLASFAVTVVVETLLALPRAPWTRDVPLRRRLIDVPLANLLTQPLAQWLHAEAGTPFAVVELGVIVAETLVYRGLTGLSWRRALLLSLVLNAATIALALWL